jgi:hypothetical protein
MRWIAGTSKSYYGGNGNPERMVGTAVDIAEHKQRRKHCGGCEMDYCLFVSESSEGIFCQELDAPIPDLP